MLVIIISGVSNLSFAQSDVNQKDSLKAKVTIGTIFSSESDFLPHYLVSNQFGEVNEENNLFFAGELSYQRNLFKNFKLESNLNFRNDLFSAYSMKLRYRDWEFSAGRVRETIGGISTGISSGSLAMSGNALPVPGISLALKEYKNIPFAKGYLKYKGSISQKWLETDRYIAKALLHEKTFYAMLDLKDEIGLEISSGVVHFAQYGGVSPQGDRQPSTFKDFLKVFVGGSIPNPDGTSEGEANGLGNHLGITEFTIKKKLGEHFVSLNYQKQFDDEGSIQYISYKDYLIGFEWDLPKKSTGINKIYLEFLQSNHQSGRGIPDQTATIQTREDNMLEKFGERDDYYNNYLYRSGWTYNGMVIGNPLFLTYQRTLNFFDPYPDYGVAIANNRISAIHLGIQGTFSTHISYKGLLTYSKNSGTYAGIYEGRFNWGGVQKDPDFEYVFRPRKKQVYSMLEIDISNALNVSSLSLNTRLAFDFGQLYNNFGLQFSASYGL